MLASRLLSFVGVDTVSGMTRLRTFVRVEHVLTYCHDSKWPVLDPTSITAVEALTTMRRMKSL